MSPKTFGCFARSAMRTGNADSDKIAKIVGEDMLEKYEVVGRWQNQSPETPLVKVVDYVAGLLVTSSAHGEELRGCPDAFRTKDGVSGTSVLREILLPPSSAALRRGAVREAIAACRAVALYGFQETRAWEGGNDYVIDTGEGSCGVVRFVGAECVAAMISYDPWRELDLGRAIAAMPRTLQTVANEVCRLPLLTSTSQRPISSVFWSEDGVLQALEPWPTVYKLGGELLRRELLDDERWQVEAAPHYELDEQEVALILNLATRRLGAADVVTMTRDEVRTILPADAPYRTEASELLKDLGLQH